MELEKKRNGFERFLLCCCVLVLSRQFYNLYRLTGEATGYSRLQKWRENLFDWIGYYCEIARLGWVGI